MPDDITPNAEIRLHPLTLRFEDDAIEARFRRARFPAERDFPGRLAAAVAGFTAAFGLLDPWLVPAGVTAPWSIRVAVCLVCGLVFVSTRSDRLPQRPDIAVALTMLAGGSGFIALFILGNDALRLQAMAASALLVAGTPAFAGLAFPAAAFSGLLLVAIWLACLPLFAGGAIVANGFALLAAANALGIAAGRDRARRERRLFALENLAEEERRQNDFAVLHDPLTGLANRTLLDLRVQQAMARADRYKTVCALLFVDLDDFKSVNELHGHRAGDVVLKTIAARLGHCVRRTDTVARIGADEFVVLYEDVKNTDHLGALAERILDQIARPVFVEGKPLTVAASIGIGVYPIDAQAPDELLRVADIAMYDAKITGLHSYTFYHPERREH
ncbi:MAG TPA: GGDEF domain-containing protein [Gammaproteobacteria bacterium]|nr:GGDEF domain-containing protein [Gammaproteobacteria bacterium]